MELSRELEILQGAQGDPALLALATVDIKYSLLTEIERASLKEALEAAAVPHWCDDDILGALLAVPREEARIRLERLRVLTIVEAFPARGVAAINVHESARLALRRRMAMQAPKRFQQLCARAAAYFEG